MKTIHTTCDLIDKFKEYASFPAIISPPKVVFYKDLFEGSHLISSIIQNNIRPESTGSIGVYVSHKIALCYTFYGIIKSGFSAMLFPEDLLPAQVKDLLERYCPDGLVVDIKNWLSIRNELETYRNPVFLVNASDTLEFRNLHPLPKNKIQYYKKHSVTPDSEAAVLFSSGTSKERKAVLITHRNLIETTKMINSFMMFNLPITELVTVSFTHSFGLRRVFCNHIIGGTIVVEDGIFNPARALKIIRDQFCRGISGVPSTFRILRKTFEAILLDLGPQIKFIELGSSALSKIEKEEFCSIFPNAQLCMHYGLTEASKATFLHFFRDRDKLHTVGRPSAGISIKIIDEKGKEIDNGQIGEIWVKGFNVAKGYLMDTKLSDEKFVDGYFKTGDIGRLDSDGYLILLGRKDDMINVGGKKMYPEELEDYLRDSYPNLDLAIAGIQNEFFGMLPVLCYTKSASVDDNLFGEIVERLRGEFEEYKLPRVKVNLPKIPRTKNGKIIREDLNQILKGSPPFYENK